MKEVLVIRANGLVVGRRSGEWYDPGVLETKLEPGDVVVVLPKGLWRVGASEELICFCPSTLVCWIRGGPCTALVVIYAAI